MSNLPVTDSLGALLLARAEAWGDRPHLRFLDEQEQVTIISYRQLAAAARSAAYGLARVGVKPGDRVALMLTTGLPLVAAIYGCHLLGATPVPLYPPMALRGIAPYLERLGRIVGAIEPRCLVAEPALVLALRAGLGRLCPRLVEPEALAGAELRALPPADPERPALIQFSSGSTGPQKGVVLTHRHLLANCAAIASRLALTEAMHGVSWLPLYHDMGLIGSVFIPLLVGIDAMLFSPRDFLLDPARWVRWASRHQAEIIMGPNFAYELLARRVDPTKHPELDLSSVRIALNGAEPIDVGSVKRFEAAFAPCGLRANVTIGVYGLAEIALGASMPTPWSGQPVDVVEAEALRLHGEARPCEAGEGAREVAALGPALDGYELEIRDEAGQPLPERREGQVAVRGPSVMQGYWLNPTGTAEAVVDGWLLTGDMGYLAGGVLHVTGRLKDLIIRGGRNYHPQELERAAERISGVRGGSAVAFGVPDPARGTEQVVLAVESRQEPGLHGAIAKEVGAAAHAATGLRPDRVLVLPPGSVPKTSSGKRQRRAARDLYLAGSLGQAPTTGQALRLAMANHLPGRRGSAS